MLPLVQVSQHLYSGDVSHFLARLPVRPGEGVSQSGLRESRGPQYPAHASLQQILVGTPLVFL